MNPICYHGEFVLWSLHRKDEIAERWATVTAPAQGVNELG
jgi:hypothetical protein